eukprot:TRINITY_DN19062_c0_g1_i1.p1 TRINITY_DN19062_c0_g1~~TRINITY_DN19062_c0_g1_i1.p1  ORF type:complete len:173 (+),score=23.18 TRINITY_DN19062_c0_g1_i1:55-519(+)
MARGKASSSGSRHQPASQPRAQAPAVVHQQHPQQPVQYQSSGGGMGSGIGGALMQGAAIGAGAEAGRMAIGSMFGGSGGAHQPVADQGYQMQGYQPYQEPQQSTNWLLWGGVAAAAAGGAFLLSRNMAASQRAILPLMAAPVAAQPKFKKPEEF